MRRALLGILLVAASLWARGQAVLEIADDFAFNREAVERFAERGYHQQLDALQREGRLDGDAAMRERLEFLLSRVVAAAKREAPEAASVSWEVHTCASCGESAAARAGGKLLVGEEFIRENALTDDEVGFVLAHEAGHVIAQHTRELATVARYFMDNGLHREYWDIQRELDGSFLVQLRTAFVAARQEEEADRIGFVLGSQAGFDPAAMVSLLTKLGASERGAGFGSHPDSKRRIAQAQAMLQPARTLYERAVPAP